MIAKFKHGPGLGLGHAPVQTHLVSSQFPSALQGPCLMAVCDARCGRLHSALCWTLSLCGSESDTVLFGLSKQLKQNSKQGH